jgi:hypothetical protein
MGNWNGTVRCGHCYGRGHNRTTCPKLTEQLQTRFERLQQAVKDGSRSEDDYTFAHVRQQLSKRTGEDPVTGEKVRRRSERHGRVCSYCKETGHNRRTCTKIQADKDMFVKLSSQARAALLGRLQKHGVGPGALLTGESYDGSKQAYLVTDIEWNHIHRKNYADGSRGTQIVKVREVSRNKPAHILLPSVVTDNESYNNKYIVAGPAPAVEPPAGWLECKDLDVDASGLFEKGEQRDYWFWNEIDAQIAEEAEAKQ